MKQFKLSNTTEVDMLVIFEPIGDNFSLPSGEYLEIILSGEEVGLDTNSINIEINQEENKVNVRLWAEKNKFEAFYRGQPVNVM